MEVLLPPRLDFFRPANLAVGPKAIFGSVSTADVATYVKEKVAYNDEASRITLSEHDVRFMGLSALEEGTRVKHMGEYEVEIGMQKVEGKIKRKVVVLAQQAEKSEQAPSLLSALEGMKEEAKAEVQG